MNTPIPLYIKPGALVKLRHGSKARIYAIDAGGLFPIHGAVYVLPDDRWYVECWAYDGSRNADPASPSDIIGPWIDPETEKLWAAFWAKIPSWINFAAMDEEGEWWAYGRKPTMDVTAWCSADSDTLSLHIPSEHNPPFTGDWEESLHERPSNET